MPKFHRQCPKTCWASPEKAGPTRAAQIHTWFEEGNTPFAVMRLYNESGGRVFQKSVYGHHKRHLIKVSDASGVDERAAELIENPDVRLSDLEILERIIQKGASALIRADSKVTPEMTMKALDLKLKLTQGSVFDSFLGAVAEAMKDEDGAAPVEEEDPDG